MIRRFRIVATSAAFAWLLVMAASGRPVAAQGAPGNINDGVFTAVQAERGREVYATSCVRCHMLDMSGAAGPSLKGERFLAGWENDSLDGLFTKIRDTMPPRIGNAILTDEQKIDVTTYLLSANGFPAGDEELPIDADRLAGIEIVRSDRQGTVRNFALVQVVGCVAAGPDSSWTLTHSTEPVVTKTSSPTVEDAATVAKPLGRDSYVLVGAARFDPAAHTGRKVQAKGLVYRAPGQNLLTVTSLQTIGSSCGS